MKSILKKPLTLAVLLATLFISSLSLAEGDIFAAIKKGDLKEVKRLVEEKKVDVNKLNIEGKTPVWFAKCNRKFRIMIYLLQKGAKKYAQEIFNAIEKGDLKEVKRLVEKEKVDVNKTNIEDITPLWFAFYNKKFKIVEYLLQKDVRKSINKACANLTPLFFAVDKNKLGKVKLLVESGANVNLVCGPFGETPLYKACKNNNFDIVKYLIEKGANKSINKAPNLGDSKGKTPLYWACKNNNLEMVKLLLQNGPKISKKYKIIVAKNIKKYFDLVETYENLKGDKRLAFVLKNRKNKDVFEFLVRFALNKAIRDNKSFKSKIFFKKLHEKLKKVEKSQIFNEPYHTQMILFVLSNLL
ncbi:ankyrin repeat domain-containing protein [Candidatus Dependentiae bacterium]